MKNRNSQKKTRRYKTNILREALVTKTDIVYQIEAAIKTIIQDNDKITAKEIVRRTDLEYNDVKLILPVFTEDKTSRIELRCTRADKLRWEYKAEQADSTISKLISIALDKLTVYVPRTQQLRAEINLLVVERIRFNVLVNQLAKWCNTYCSNVDQFEVLAMLNELQGQFDGHDKAVMAAINKKHSFDGLGTRVITNGVDEWEY